MKRKPYPAYGDMSSGSHSDSIIMDMVEESPKRPHFESPLKNLLSFKRKCSYDEVSLSEQIKRFKITSTPGELRLQKDLQELQLCGIHGFSILYPDETGSVTVEFLEAIPFAPSIFRISVPRYYPHNHPIIFCLNEGNPSQFILQSGEIIHSSLREEWSAIGTLSTVIDILQSIRLRVHSTLQSDFVNVSNRSSFSHEMTEMKESHEIYMNESILSEQRP